MPETACLHIQTRESDPVRVVELPGASIRIGRASYCDVRLSEPEVADEECLLRRRGETWHLFPKGPPGSMRIDGELVERPRPLPFGVSLQVGAHSLTLRQVESRTSGWGTYQTPIPIELPAGRSPMPTESRAEMPIERPTTPEAPVPRSGTPTSARRDGNTSGSRLIVG